MERKKSRSKRTQALRAFLFTCALVRAFGFEPETARASSDNPIGRIVYLDKKYWALRVKGPHGNRDAVSNGMIYEGDKIQTVASQHLSVLLVDGSEILVGPSSRVEFANWNERDSLDRLIRKIKLHTGMVKAKIRKVYSQQEPFLIENKYGVVAVVGTEFVVEAGPGGRLEHARRVSAAEAFTRRTEVEVHALEGEVYFAKSFNDFQKPESRVSLTAGQTSLVRLNLSRPQQPRAFDLKIYQSYMAKAVPPKSELRVVRNTTNERRSERAANTRQETAAKAISPAQPEFAKIRRSSQDASRAADAAARAIAGAKGNEGPIEKKLRERKYDSRMTERRREILDSAGVPVAKPRREPGSLTRGRGEKGVHSVQDAFSITNVEGQGRSTSSNSSSGRGNTSTDPTLLRRLRPGMIQRPTNTLPPPPASPPPNPPPGTGGGITGGS